MEHLYILHLKINIRGMRTQYVACGPHGEGVNHDYVQLP